MSRVEMSPKARSSSVTTGLRWAPETAPSIQISPMSAPAVAAAFSKSSRPMSNGDSRLAMIPDPITAITRRPVPSASATRRRARSRCRAPVPVSGWWARSLTVCGSAAAGGGVGHERTVVVHLEAAGGAGLRIDGT